MRASTALLLVLFLCLNASAPAAEDADAPPPSLSYSVKIDPKASNVSVSGKLAGRARGSLKKFVSLGLRKQVRINVGGNEKVAEFNYEVPIDQDQFKDTFQPVLSDKHCAIFLGSIILAPQVEGVELKDIQLRLELPEGWKIATSRGLDKATWKLETLRDLGGTLVCAGDYATYSFELDHRGSDGKTRFHVAIRGARDWDDGEFMEEYKRLVRGQMDYFGGSHPAPIQFLALHLLPAGQSPSIPAFNRRAPGHDTVLALHTPNRPREHFEFLGMLAHEHLHNWYPNAMKSDLGPWFMEGLNDYVAYRGLLANKLHTRKQFSGMLSKWHREYLMCVRTKNMRVMPYRRGMIAGWVFDIETRRATGGKHGLTDVLLRLIKEEPEGGVVQRAHFLAMLKKVSGQDMEELYKHLVEEDAPVELSKHLAGTGFAIETKEKGIVINPVTAEEKKLFEAILSE